MIVAQAMSSKFVSIDENASWRDLWKLIFHKRINAVPVTNSKNKLVGIIAREDILQILYPTYQEFIEDFLGSTDYEMMEDKVKELSGLKAKDIMCSRIIFTRDHTFIMRALSRMITHRIDQLPVLDSQNNLVGMITKSDIFNSLFKSKMTRKKS